MRLTDDAGYATPTAAVISLALSLVAAAVVMRSLAEFRLAKQDFAKTQTELELAAAQNAAILAIATSAQPPPYRWVLPSLGEAISVIAEPEFNKVGLPAASQLEPAAFSAFQVSDPAALGQRLGALADAQSLVWVADEDASPLWRKCAASYVSPFGQGVQVLQPTYREPVAGKQPSSWRAGEVWRIVVSNQQGWRDERFVRFTGNGEEPAAVVGRRVSKSDEGLSTCETLIG